MKQADFSNVKKHLNYDSGQSVVHSQWYYSTLPSDRVVVSVNNKLVWKLLGLKRNAWNQIAVYTLTVYHDLKMVLHWHTHTHTHAYIYIYIYIYTHTHTHTHTYIYIYICVCVNVFGLVWFGFMAYQSFNVKSIFIQINDSISNSSI